MCFSPSRVSGRGPRRVRCARLGVRCSERVSVGLAPHGVAHALAGRPVAPRGVARALAGRRSRLDGEGEAAFQPSERQRQHEPPPELARGVARVRRAPPFWRAARLPLRARRGRVGRQVSPRPRGARAGARRRRSACGARTASSSRGPSARTRLKVRAGARSCSGSGRRRRGRRRRP